MKLAADEQRKRAAEEKRICSTEGVGLDQEVVDAMHQKSEAKKRADYERHAAKEEQASPPAEQEDGNWPYEIELLLDGQGPEVGQWQTGRPAVAADGVSDEIGVLEIKGER